MPNNSIGELKIDLNVSPLPCQIPMDNPIGGPSKNINKITFY